MKTVMTLKMKTAAEIDKTVRRTWAIKPFSRVAESKKRYSRRDGKAALRAALREF